MKLQRLIGLVAAASLGLELIAIPMQGWSVPVRQVAQANPIPAPLQRAYSLLGQGLVDQAIAEFERYLQRNPQSIEGRLGVAIAYRRAGRDADAFAAYEQVLARSPNNQLALLSLGFLGEFRPEWQQRGINALTTLLQLDPNNTEGRAQRGRLYFFQGRFSEAIADFAQVLATDPNPPTAVLITAAEVYTYGGAPQRGLDLFNQLRGRGLVLSPSATLGYATALRETGNVTAAIQVLETAVQRSPQLDSETIRLRSALASTYAANGQLQRAEAAIAPLRNRPDSRLDLARALNRMGELDSRYRAEAAALYRQVLMERPEIGIGVAREAADVLSTLPAERSFALQLYDELAQQSPNDRGLQTQRLVLATQLGLISRADLRQELRQTFPSLPDDPTQLQGIAQALIQLDPPDPQLLPLFQALLAADVNQPFLTFRVAQMLAQTGDFNGARATLSTYAATPQGERDRDTIILFLAGIDQQEGNLEAAAQRYESLLVGGISNPATIDGALRGLAGVRQRQGRIGEALAIYDQLVMRNPQDLDRQIGRAAIAYEAGVLSEGEAIALLNVWQQRPDSTVSPDVIALVGALPPDPQREALYRSLLDVQPDSVALQLRLAQVVAQRSPAEGEALLRQITARNPNDPGAYLVQAQVAQELGNLTLATESYETVLAQQPDNPDALSGLAGVRFQQRRLDEASRLYNRVLELNPQNQTARLALIELQAAQGRRMEALEQLRELQRQQAANGIFDPSLAERIQRIEEGFLQQRGFQPGWE
ncbi:MAG: tetratricopeptide repeat protein [Cyanobacteria bacterium J06638_20]